MKNSKYDVANAINIRKVITHYTGVDVSTTTGNINCPFHTDKSPSFRIYDNTNTYHCFSCKSSGTPINFVSEHLGITVDGAADEIVTTFNLSYTKPKVNPEYEQYVRVFNYMAGFYNVLSNHKEAVGLNFWNDRGLQPLVKEMKLGYSLKTYIAKDNTVMTLRDILLANFPDITPHILDSYGLYDKYGNCNMAGRFVFPINDAYGNTIAFSGRSLDSGVPKYINTPETQFFKKRNVLYNYDKAKRYSLIYVVEGYTDALSLIINGIPNVVAAMGTSFSDEHITMLKDKQIVLAFDNDMPGQCKMVDLIEAHPHVAFKVYQLKGHDDFNTKHMAGEEIKINPDKETVYGPEFLIRFLKEELDLGFLYEREELFNRVNAVAKKHSPVARDYFATILRRILKGRRV